RLLHEGHIRDAVFVAIERNDLAFAMLSHELLELFSGYGLGQLGGFLGHGIGIWWPALLLVPQNSWTEAGDLHCDTLIALTHLLAKTLDLHAGGDVLLDYAIADGEHGHVKWRDVLDRGPRRQAVEEKLHLFKQQRHSELRAVVTLADAHG